MAQARWWAGVGIGRVSQCFAQMGVEGGIEGGVEKGGQRALARGVLVRGFVAADAHRDSSSTGAR